MLLYCVVIEILTHNLSGKRQMFVAWNRITSSSWEDSGTSCFSLPRTDVSPDGRAAWSIGTDRQIAASFSYRLNSAFVKTHERHLSCTTALPVWMSDILHQTAEFFLWLPTPGAHWIIAFSTGRITVSQRNARPREPSPLSGVGGVSGLGPG